MLDGGDRAARWRSPRTRSPSHRASGIRFAAAIFTNLTQDHLDFHDTMEEYFAAKRCLFDGELAPRVSVVNLGDAYGRRLADRPRAAP